jgi:hypothetical protein
VQTTFRDAGLKISALSWKGNNVSPDPPTSNPWLIIADTDDCGLTARQPT